MDRDALRDRLRLCMRQCSTHPAGPMQAVAALAAADLDHDDITALMGDAGAYVDASDMLDDRKDAAQRFLTIVGAGLHVVATARLAATGP